MKIAVIGSKGYVGSAFVNMLKPFYEVMEIDKDEAKDLEMRKKANECELGIVCVPTGMDKTKGFPYACDTSIVESVIEWLDTPVILIKSTVAPGTTDRLKEKYNKRICMSPEYIGEGRYFVPSHLDFSKEMVRTPFWIIGGDSKDVKYIYDILVPILGPLKRYITIEAIEAELVKYWENITLGMRVVLANEMKKSCEAFGANYYNVREGWLADPRMDYWHSIAFEGKPGFSGKCLPKDLNAFLRACEDRGIEMPLLRGVLSSNFKMRKEKDLETQYEYIENKENKN